MTSTFTPSLVVFTRRLRRSGLVASCCLSLSCAAVTQKGAVPPAESSPVTSNPGSLCQAVTAFEPPPQSLAPSTIPKSQLRVHADVPLAKIHDRIAREIPRVLASEKDRPVGAPGLATFTVVRGSPTLRTDGERLSVRVPVSADISVCKPIGSGCFKYGSCSPELEATFSIQSSFGPAYSLAPPKGSIHATKRCVIGFDVTSQIESIAKSEVAKVEAQIRRLWPDFETLARSSWNEFSRPLSLMEGVCFHFTPEQLSYVEPKIKNDKKKDGKTSETLSTALALEGTLSPSASCVEERRLPPLAEAERKQSLPQESQIWVPELLTVEQIRETLDAHLTGKLPNEEGTVSLQEVRLGKKRLFLHLTLEGKLCGTLWVSAAVEHRLGDRTLELSDWTISRQNPEPGQKLTPSELSLLAHLSDKARVPLLSADWFVPEQKDRLKALLTKSLPPELKLEVVGLQANPARISAREEGLQLLHPVSAVLRIRKL
jgi:hypothetical protein